MREDNPGDRTQPHSAGIRHRVLLIEDHAPLAEATAEFMRAWGLEVRIASTGKTAVEMADAFKPEIVLCDMRLPDMPGLDVAQALRATSGAKDALIVIITAMTQRDLPVAERHDDAVNAFFSKPLTAQKLETLISQLALHRSAAQARNRTA
jgi:two-component system OmpR family response regulator